MIPSQYLIAQATHTHTNTGVIFLSLLNDVSGVGVLDKWNSDHTVLGSLVGIAVFSGNDILLSVCLCLYGSLWHYLEFREKSHFTRVASGITLYLKSKESVPEIIALVANN